MRLFLDTSVLLAASGSGKGASRFVVAEAAARGWELVSSDYCEEETRRNLPKLGRSAAMIWSKEIAPRERGARQAARLPESQGSARRHHGLGDVSPPTLFTDEDIGHHQFN